MRWLLLLLLTGCATHAAFREGMDAWVGKPVDALVGELGPPHAAHRLNNGGAVLQWTTEQNTVIPVPQQTYGTASAYGNTLAYQSTTTPGAYNIHLACTVRVTVSPDGLIQSWASSGNNCIR